MGHCARVNKPDYAGRAINAVLIVTGTGVAISVVVDLVNTNWLSALVGLLILGVSAPLLFATRRRHT